MRTWKAGGCNHRGFTLVELVVVMLVIGIIAAVAMPRVSGMLDRQNMRRTINVVRGTVRYLQARAALTKRTYRLTLDLDNQVMSACYLTEESCQKEHNRVLRDYEFPPTVQVLDLVNLAGEKIQEGEVSTHFYPSGNAEPSVIHLSGSGTERMTLMIEELTGRLKVLDGYVVPTTS
jgi:prepilin-type N-terminal cleavage/methylation domain-containing protein